MALRVPGNGNQGTGFIIAPGIVATCAHVLADDIERLPPLVTVASVWSGQSYDLVPRREDYHRSAAGLDLALLRFPVPPEARHVLPNSAIAIGDPLWAYGHPAGGFRAGQPATFHYEGESRRDLNDDLPVLRLRGTPVGAGFSGSAVVNRRTGAVCGMLCTSDKSGSAHMLPIAEIVGLCDEARRIGGTIWLSYQHWLRHLDDAQLRAGGWAVAGPKLLGYLTTAARAAHQHPYPAVTGGRTPSLTEVYVQQDALSEDTMAGQPGDSAAGLPASVLFDRPGDSLLIGGPGAGKSSLLRAAVTFLVGRWLRGETPVAPVRVLAGDLVASSPLPEAISASVRADLSAIGLRQSWPPEFFAEPPVPGGCWLVLVDGLDEVMNHEQRRTILTKLAGARAEMPDGLYRFIVASRPMAPPHVFGEADWKPTGFQLLEFTENQYKTFTERWFRHLEIADPEEKAQEFVTRIKDVGLAELARTPLVATMLCQVFANDPDTVLPGTRSLLYEAFVEMAHSRQFQAVGGIRSQLKGILGPYGEEAERAGEALLVRTGELIGFLAFRRQQGDTGSSVDLLGARTAALRPGHVPERIWLALLAEVLRRNGVLVEYGDNFAFLHRTVEEYLAARFVTGDPELSEQEFRSIFDPGQDTAPIRPSYVRFLVTAWQDRRDLGGALAHLVRRGDPDDLRFVASLVTDGVLLEPRLRAEVANGLVAVATDPQADGFTRRSAAEALLQVDQARAMPALRRIAATNTIRETYRLWAVTTMAAALRDGSDALDDEIARTPWAMRVLAESADTEMRRLLRAIAGDTALQGRTRFQAANALCAVEPDAGLFAAIAQDPMVTKGYRLDAARAWAEYDERGAKLLAELAGESSGKATSRVRARLARRISSRNPLVNSVLEPVVEVHRAHHPRADFVLLQEAYDFAERKHRGQYRESGDPYITHPLAVATILTEMGSDTDTVAAGLLHAVVEHTDCDLDEVYRMFGPDIAALVDAVTELDRDLLGPATDAESIRKLVIASARDPRGLVLKLADRLHIMRTMRYLPAEQQARRARETLEILAPLARRMSINVLAAELEDLSFAILMPKRYDEVVRAVVDRAAFSDQAWSEVKEILLESLASAKIKAEIRVEGRRYHSIHQRVLDRGDGAVLDADDISVGVLLVRTVPDCYAALGVVHALWNPKGKLSDYVASPRFGLYQSLHTTVVGPGGRPLEIRIRTHEMHRSAEYGAADAGIMSGEAAWLRQLLDWQREIGEPGEFLDTLRGDLAREEIYVFTPKGDTVVLPQDATTIDFAYAIHTEVGHRYAGAKVNDREVTPETRLQDGDTVEVVTSDDVEPVSAWLNSVVSPRAKTKIKQALDRKPQDAETTTRATIEVLALDQRLLTVDLLRVLDASDLVLVSVTVSGGAEHEVRNHLVVEARRPEQIAAAVEALRAITAVLEVIPGEPA
ncbi:HD domain-containing protein [Amycolatopsis coloradensis]|nr:HD domain-containing protein [Amycolatopsis coloradensis]